MVRINGLDERRHGCGPVRYGFSGASTASRSVQHE